MPKVAADIAEPVAEVAPEIAPQVEAARDEPATVATDEPVPVEAEVVEQTQPATIAAEPEPAPIAAEPVVSSLPSKSISPRRAWW